MDRYTDKIRNIYQEMLALDSIYNVLSWHDRVTIHKLMNNDFNTPDFSLKARMLYEFIEDSGWTSPFMKYGQDRLLYFQDDVTRNDHLIEEYKQMYTHITSNLKIRQNELFKLQ